MTSQLEAADALFKIRGFIGNAQLQTLGIAMRGEEKDFFRDKVVELATLITAMPKTYEQEGKGDDAIVTLHYFTAGCDWYITEKDSERQQHQAYGWAYFGDREGEIGYISIVELLSVGAELDFHFRPRTLGEVKTSGH